MQQSIFRAELLSAVTDALSEAPVVALLGARQVGKTTLAGQIASAWPGASALYDLEVAAVREALSATPDRLLRNTDGLVVIDEVQRMPALFELLRPICDDPNRQAVELVRFSGRLVASGRRSQPAPAVFIVQLTARPARAAARAA